MKCCALIGVLLGISGFVGNAYGEEPEDTLNLPGYDLDEVVVRGDGVRKMRNLAGNSELITAAELTRAACCNLGESFTTNPSVDVNYSDAVTGARQIRLLGLAGTYVQMLTENVPNFRGAAAPFGLGYVPGPWMQSISVSKGASSVKNGYESVSGQINVEMLKPQAEPSLSINGYLDHMLKAELNAAGNLNLGKGLHGGLLLHGENSFMSHDGNHDGFMDRPKVRQLSAMNRWAYMSTHYVFQLALKYLDERRESGQMHPSVIDDATQELYRIGIRTHRGEAFMKHAYIFDKENDGNVALIVSGSYHDQDANYGRQFYDVGEGNIYAQLMFERKWREGLHALSTGISFNYDDFRENYLLQDYWTREHSRVRESVGGVYAQYTLNLDQKLIAMAGLRYDQSSRFGGLFTPRVHIRWNINDDLSINASAGRGFRAAHPLAELSYLLASSRKIVGLDILTKGGMEKAWNFGAGANWTMPWWERRISLAADYYYTFFNRQLCVNMERDPHAVEIYMLKNGSRSHTFQVEMTIRPIDDLSFTGAYRLTDVKMNYGNGMQQKPLTSRNKGLFTVSYTPMMGIWQADVTLSVNGSGRMPAPYETGGKLSWQPRYTTFCTLNAQLTRNFRHWSIYVGGENLTNFHQMHPIIGADNPWGNDYDSTMIWGPIDGAMIYIGFRYHL